MRLLVGLGNPGDRYESNRHNIGFMVVEAIARRQHFGRWGKGFHGVAARGSIGGENTWLLLPDTFMNDSGLAVGATIRFYKLAASDVIVFHDDLDLQFGKVRVKVGGGNAGHRGLESVTAHIGNNYKRVRIGVGHPGDKRLVLDYVLANFSKTEQEWVDALCDVIAENVELIIEDADSTFQNRVLLAMRKKGFDDSKAAGDGPDEN